MGTGAQYQDPDPDLRISDGVRREVSLRAPVERDPSDTHRIWELHAAAYGLNDAPVAFPMALQLLLLRAEAAAASWGLKFQVSTSGPRSYFVSRLCEAAVGALAEHIGDVLGCGEPDIFAKARKYSGRRSGDLRFQEQSIVHVGPEVS